jgi:hypothetical protein
VSYNASDFKINNATDSSPRFQIKIIFPYFKTLLPKTTLALLLQIQKS